MSSLVLDLLGLNLLVLQENLVGATSLREPALLQSILVETGSDSFDIGAHIGRRVIKIVDLFERPNGLEVRAIYRLHHFDEIIREAGLSGNRWRFVPCR